MNLRQFLNICIGCILALSNAAKASEIISNYRVVNEQCESSNAPYVGIVLTFGDVATVGPDGKVYAPPGSVQLMLNCDLLSALQNCHSKLGKFNLASGEGLYTLPELEVFHCISSDI
jgi:hypothetical protein